MNEILNPQDHECELVMGPPTVGDGARSPAPPPRTHPPGYGPGYWTDRNS